ncbi:MAG: hypothetical protein GY856_47830, partial [bacterium]|nr:hypothetical protein [bacterium]
GFPSIIWTLAVDRINQQAESAGLEIESVYLLILSDDKPNPADEGIQVGEKIPCLDLLRKHNSGDAQRFNEFFRVYSNHLEVIERDPGIPPIRRIGEDGTGYFSAYEIRPKPASLNLADALRIEPEDYSVRSDGTYAGTVAVTPKFAGIAPAEVVSLNVELWDQGAAVFGPTPISPDLGEQELWIELPGHLGEVSGADRQYAIRAAVTVRFPAEDADGQHLSQFVTTLTYVTPVPVVRFVGLLADSEGRLIDPTRIKPGETQEHAKRRIDGGLSLKQVVFWSIVAVIAAIILAGILYLIIYWAPARLEVVPGQPREVVIDLRTAERSDETANLGSVRIENVRSKRGRFAEWTGELRIDEVVAHPGLRTAADVPRLEELVTFHKLRRRRQSGKVTDRQYRVLELYLLQGLVEDLVAPGLPDDQGRFVVDLRITVSLITSAKVKTRTCVLSVPIQVLAMRARWSAEWMAGEGTESRYLYSDILSQPQIIQRLRVFHDHEQQALWPQPVRLVLRGPQREPNPSLRFGACVQGEDLGTAR